MRSLKSDVLRRSLLLAASVVGLIALDQLVKALAAAAFPAETDFHTVVGGFLYLRCLHNTGCAWSLLSGHVWPLALFGLAVFGLLVWQRQAVFSVDAASRRVTRFLPRLAEPLLYAGILGNVIDRVFRGAVIDMFDFQFGTYHYPCFNCADVYICTAAGLLILASFLPKVGSRVPRDRRAST